MTTDARVEEGGYAIARKKDQDQRRLINLARAFIRQHEENGLFEALGIPAPSVHAIIDRIDVEDGHVARMFVPSIDFAAEPPGILLQTRAMLKAFRKARVSYEDGVESTLLHEYGHMWAFQEFDSSDIPGEEEIVERFAHETWRTGDWMAALEDMKRELRARANV